MTQPVPIQRAIENLAQELGLSPSQVAVVMVAEAEWSDSSLGCPQPGRAYLQVITAGYRTILEANGKQYEYHTDRHGTIVRCGS